MPNSSIQLRGVRQNNLKGFDLDLPLGQLIVVTGPSGSGKSSLAFDTLYAEGQRRYVETFNPYTRQFLARMDKPQVDSIKGILPAIAIGQANAVRSSRSTVGTITEINDYLKLFFARVAEAYCPECKQRISASSVKDIVDALIAKQDGEDVLVTFDVAAPKDADPADFFQFLNSQGYVRVLLYGQVVRTDEELPRKALPALVAVVQDRVTISKKNRSRLSEAVEMALRLGNGKINVVLKDGKKTLPFSSHWICAHCDVEVDPPKPGYFSFNTPLGACPTCNGFGRTIGLDWDKILPDQTRSIREGVVRPFQGGLSAECQKDLLRAAAQRGVNVHCAFNQLPEDDRDWVINGEGGNVEESWQNDRWYGVQGYFDYLETKTYKMHVRVLLSRYRNYQPCPDCGGTRYRSETSNYRLPSVALSLPDLTTVPVKKLHEIFSNIPLPANDTSAQLLHGQIFSRLGYLMNVGLGYLTLNRTTRTLSGGEVERVNLTACLGASLTNTLFVLDEPSIGLHPRDTGRLLEVLHALRDKGNTLVVVEHEEAVIRAADFLVDIGPGRGREGGELVYAGQADALPKTATSSLTKDYLTGKKTIPVPKKRRKPTGWIKMTGINHHNLQNVNANFPLGVMCCVTGVSGSGKSSLVHGVLFRSLAPQTENNTFDEEAGTCRTITGDENVGDIIMVDQSPLSKTPRSTPAVYVGAYDKIRDIYGKLEDSVAAGFTPSSFSFNSGDGRCNRCNGLGFERIEMQFLSDVYLRCPECDGKRFQPHLLAIKWDGRSIADILALTVREALEVFRDHEQVLEPLQLLDDVGLGYLQLGQRANELSGGEAQRLKLAGHLAEHAATNAVLIFDEPTTGLHFDDIAKLLNVFQRLVDAGNHVVVIEHNTEVIKCADWVIDLGPEAGDDGGKIIAAGTPEKIATTKGSHTGEYLKRALAGKREAFSPPRKRAQTLDTDHIVVRGAREHNLKNVNVNIPREKVVVVTGLSGSGKSTLAFDILFAEGQRRFLDSMSAYARQFVEQLEKPDVDSIEGLPPSVAIEQRITRGGGKSTVATITEIYHFLRLLYAKFGTQYCPKCNVPVSPRTLSDIATTVRNFAAKGTVAIYAPLIKGRKGYHDNVARNAAKQGIETLWVDGHHVRTDAFTKLERFKEHTIDALIGRVDSSTPAASVTQFISDALKMGKGTARVLDTEGKSHTLSTEMNCPKCDQGFEELDPRLFSFNSPHGWCPDCRGFGTVAAHARNEAEFDSALAAELDEEARQERRVNNPAIPAEEDEDEDSEQRRPCPTCNGTRINETARNVKIVCGTAVEKEQSRSTKKTRSSAETSDSSLSIPSTITLPELAANAAVGAKKLLNEMHFEGPAAEAARDIIVEITRRLDFLARVGLEYLTLDRGANTLSGGESQRIRLAAQLGSNLHGVLYVLDEPTIGLHARDNSRLLDAIGDLARDGNTLLVVEHDEETMSRADHIIDLGPGAGSRGGEIVVEGSNDQILSHEHSATARALREPMPHPLRGERRPIGHKQAKWITLEGATIHNLRKVKSHFPLNRLTVVTGVSGSGKSSLVRGVLEPALREAMNSRRKGKSAPSNRTYSRIAGYEDLGGVLVVDQSPIGKTSRSTPATYIKVFDAIRDVYAELPESRVRGYTNSRYSYNNEGGRCEACMGQGVIKVEMNFLPPAYMPCEHCNGLRFNPATLEILYNGKSIGDALQMTVEEAAEFFSAHPKIRHSLNLLVETGLGYLRLGQPSPTLSGGEAQRIKLVTEIARRPTRKAEEVRTARKGKSTLYILEEPTIGLHASDIARLIDVLHRLVDEGGTVIVVEHHLDVIAEADYILEIGPGAGEEGGRVVIDGTPEDVAASKEGATAPFLAKQLKIG